ncbi:MAG TPA: tagaturonate epimerase family protein [Candidatus Atribacteria bacterium]|nr:tagaturonate epimerase family protein [Candidatus Atribacteria bacterium]
MSDFSKTKEVVKKIGERINLLLRVYSSNYHREELGMVIYPVKGEKERYLGVWSRDKKFYFADPLFLEPQEEKGGFFFLYPFHFKNYLTLSGYFPDLKPQPAGVRTSLGCGDRLGLVSRAHLEAIKDYPVFPVIAQQSPRELQKMERTFQDVLLGAAWGVLESGNLTPFGADADHLKDEEYLRAGIESGFSMYTLDGSGVASYEMLSKSEKELQKIFDSMPQGEREIFNRYADRTLTLQGGLELDFRKEKFFPLFKVYFPVINFVEKMNFILQERLSSYDLEVSLDEGEGVTSPEVHFFVAEELHRRGIDFKSLAPRFPGSFEKAIDYQGNIQEFSFSLQSHVIVQQEIGGYRLSLHSGSDKFSIYPVFSRETNQLFHLKTSGTSWLKGLEVVAHKDPQLFRKIYELSEEELEENSKAYQISFTKEDIHRDMNTIPDSDLLILFSHPLIRQFLHISYGSVWRAFKSELSHLFFQYEEEHYRLVRENMERHLRFLFSLEENIE